MRKRKSLKKPNSKVVIVVEGKNETEKRYFSKFKSRKCNIELCPGNETDAKGMLEKLISYIIKKDIKKEYGDSLYLIVDIDNNKDKFDRLINLKASCDQHGIKIIISNSSFELWFLLHFIYSTKKFSNKELITELKKYINNYDKSIEVYELIKNRTNIAIRHSKDLVEFHNIDGIEFYNPYTNVYEIVEDLLERNNISKQ